MKVVDTNVLISLLINHSSSHLEFIAQQTLVAPTLCKTEFVHVLMKYINSNIVSRDAAHQILSLFDEITELMNMVGTADIYELASHYQISAYDAEFVALAIVNNTDLFTYDKRLICKFPQICIKPVLS
jgi:predicted nucleic acid-binding protein